MEQEASAFSKAGLQVKLLHINNIVNPLQMPLARCLMGQLGEDKYRYAATMPTESAAYQERTKMGWNCGDQESWILRVSETGAARKDCVRWWTEADVVLCGERAIGPLANRLKQGLLTFYTSERWWKPPLGMARILHPRFALMALRFKRLGASQQFHYLPIGHYAAKDMQRWAAFSGRSWLWAYFTALPTAVPQVARPEAGLEILWAGRMLGWKRVDTLVRAFGDLRRQNEAARLTLIGDGPERQKLEALAQRLGLSGAVSFRSSLPMEQVWARMHSAHVYVLPSNGFEGWGAVVNEAMNQGCAVVASEAAGSAKTMILHGQNGFLFRAGDWRQLGELLCQLSTDEALRLRLAQAGQKTVAEYWSPQVAADRFLAVSEALLSRRSPPAYDHGPMTPL